MSKKRAIITIREKLQRGYLNFARKFIPYFNEFEDCCLADEFNSKVLEIKENNSQIVFNAYYLPKAISAILKEDGYLITEQQAYPRAKAMMLSDMANGILNEFYKFVN